MAKSGRSPVLFEVMGKRPSSDAGRVEISGESPGQVAGPGKKDVIEPGSTGERSSPLLSLDGNRVNVSLTSVGVAVVVVCVVMVLIAAYGIGQTWGYESGFVAGADVYRAGAFDEIEEARSGPVSPGLLQGLRTEPHTGDVESSVGAVKPDVRDDVPGASPVDNGPVWVRGNTYIVVQEFMPGSGDDALVAQEFLAEHDIPTVVVVRDNGGSWLITTQGYNCKDKAQAQMAQRLLERVGEVGEAFQSAGGRYRLEGYLRSLTSDMW